MTNDTADGISRRTDFIPTDRPASSVDLREFLRTILDQHVEQVDASGRLSTSENIKEDLMVLSSEMVSENLLTLFPIEKDNFRRGQLNLEFQDFDHAMMAYTLLSSSDIRSLCKANYAADKRFGPMVKYFFKGGQENLNRITTENTSIAQTVGSKDLTSARNKATSVDKYLGFAFIDGLLWYEQYEQNGENLRLCIPDSVELKKRILFSEHDDVSRGHPGIYKTLCFVKRKYYWNNMHRTVAGYVNSCEKCQRNKHRQTRPPGLLNALPIPEVRWQHITMDFILRLPLSGGYNGIWVIMDRLSKRGHFIPIHMGDNESSAKMCAAIFSREYQRWHGIPESIISDRDVRFTSDFWNELMRLQGCKLLLSSAFRPNTDGQSERTNRFIGDYLRNYTHGNQEDWSQYIHFAEIAYNSRIHESIKMSPFEADLGYVPRSIPDVVFDRFVGSKNTKDAGLLYHRNQETLKVLKENLKQAQSRVSKYYNRNRPVQLFEVGDKVMLSAKNLDIQHLGVSLAGTAKLGPLWIGPYIVLTKTSIDTYRLQLPIGLKLHPEFHTSLLKPYIQDSDRQRMNKPNEGMLGAGGVTEAFLIDDIIGHKKMKKKIYYHVKWLGFPTEYDTWEEHANIYKPASGLINNYLERKKLDKKVWNPKV